MTPGDATPVQTARAAATPAALAAAELPPDANPELGLFLHARNWKRYWSRAVRRFLGPHTLDVGAGIGSNLEYMHVPGRRWTAVEPHGPSADRLRARVAAGELPADTEVVTGSLRDLGEDRRFDAITYIDVLEHIRDDRAEIAAAASLLVPGGRLVVLAPAYQFLFSPFDERIGHHRRYTARTLLDLTPAGLDVEWKGYLDSAGLAASLGNRLLLKKSLPNAGNIALWDRVLVPLSRVTDLLTFRPPRTLLRRGLAALRQLMRGD